MAISKYQISIKGITIIEILVVIAVMTIAFGSLLGIVLFSLKVSATIKETTQANSLAQEVIEAVRNFRDGTIWEIDGLGTLTNNVDYYPEKSGDIPPKWTLIQGVETLDAFTRKVVFERVSRDPITDDIEAIYNPMNNDSDTSKAIATVFWKDKDIEVITYLTNWRQ